MTYDERRLLKSLIRDIDRWRKRDEEGYDVATDLLIGIQQSLRHLVTRQVANDTSNKGIE